MKLLRELATAYATLFVGLYDDGLGTLTYFSCGHLPALLLRSSGEIVRLASNAPVLGLFPGWPCEPRKEALLAGDTLVMYTYGVTEASNRAEDEFGEERLIQALRQNAGRSPREIIDAILGDLSRFSGQEQSDDITLVVARRRAAP